MIPSREACESGNENVNLFSSGALSATLIGVNAAMTSALAAAVANQAADVDPCSTAQKDAIALIKTRALVGAAISQNHLERV
jgi:hypothetical protein